MTRSFDPPSSSSLFQRRARVGARHCAAGADDCAASAGDCAASKSTDDLTGDASCNECYCSCEQAANMLAYSAGTFSSPSSSRVAGMGN
jgi:hypothetical protein